MLFAKLILTTTMAVLGVHGPHHHSAHHCRHPFGIWHGFTGRSEFVTRGMVGEIEGQNVLPPMLMDLPQAIFRPPAPLVVLYQQRESAPPPPSDPTGEIFSVDRPDFWTPVPYGPVTVEVRLPLPPNEDVTVEYIDLLLDGQPVDSTRYFVGPQVPPEMLPDGQLEARYIYRLPCMAPGKHIVQARYKIRSLWSRISEPLHFDVRIPNPPRIIALSDVGQHPTPLRKAGRISVTRPDVTLQFADIRPDDQIVVYLNGKPVGPATNPSTTDACCRTVRLQGHIVPGVHTLTARVVHSDTSCSITSKPSNEVVFHYYDEEVYLLRPEGKPKTTKRETENPHTSTPASIGQPEELSAPAPVLESDPQSLWNQLNRQFPSSRSVHETPADSVKTASTAPSHDSAFTLVAFQPPEQTGAEAQRVLAEAIKARDRAVRLKAETQQMAKEARNESQAASNSATRARQESDTASRLREAAVAPLAQARDFAQAAKAEPVANAKAATEAAFRQLAAAAKRADIAANRALLKSQVALSKSTDAARSESIAAAAATRAEETLGELRDSYKRVKDELNAGNTGNAKDALAEMKVHLMTIEDAANETYRERELTKDLRLAVVHGRAGVDKAATIVVEERKRSQAEAVLVAQGRDATRAGLGRWFDEAATVQVETAEQAAQTAAKSAAQALLLAENAEESAQAAEAAAKEATDGASKTKRLRGSAEKAAEQAADANGEANLAMSDAKKFADLIPDSALNQELDRPGDGTAGTTEAARASDNHLRRVETALATAVRKASEAIDAHTRIRDYTRQAGIAKRQAAGFAEKARHDAQSAANHAASAVTARELATKANREANAARRDAIESLQRGDVDAANLALDNAKSAGNNAVSQSKEAERHRASAEEYSNRTVGNTDLTHQAAAAATELLKKVTSEERSAWSAQQSARVHADNAIALAALIGKTDDLKQNVEKTADSATLAEARADARIAIVEAEARVRRAEATDAPPSPYYFASAAHFPMPAFGLRGEVLDRPGAIIYEDMRFSFDREGNYNLRFSARLPAQPTDLHLQLRIQPTKASPWYTVTLAPIQFAPEEGPEGRLQSRIVRDHIVEGRSEILRRCYPQMGEETTIRRQGTARFGFGYRAHTP